MASQTVDRVKDQAQALKQSVKNELVAEHTGLDLYSRFAVAGGISCCA